MFIRIVNFWCCAAECSAIPITFAGKNTSVMYVNKSVLPPTRSLAKTWLPSPVPKEKPVTGGCPDTHEWYSKSKGLKLRTILQILYIHLLHPELFAQYSPSTYRKDKSNRRSQDITNALRNRRLRGHAQVFGSEFLGVLVGLPQIFLW